jgi:hypothetical protein
MKAQTLNIALNIVLCGCIALTSCRHADHPVTHPSPPATATAATSRSAISTSTETDDAKPGVDVTSSGGTYIVHVSPPPSAFPLNTLFAIQFGVHLRDGHAIPNDAIRVSVDAAMPAHHHGMTTQPKVIANPDGTYTARGMLLHMSGEWELYIDITRAGQTERAVVGVTLE